MNKAIASLGAQALPFASAQLQLSRLGLEVIFFYLLIFANVSFSRDFSYLHLRFISEPPYIVLPTSLSAETSFLAQSRLPGLPIYANEIVLAFILGGLALRRWREN